MIENIIKKTRSSKDKYDFCVLIPTWNNLEFLQACVSSILKNSYLDLQVILIINEGSDGTLEWVCSLPETDYVYSKNNIGICYGLNIARALIKSDYVVYVNDDMHLLPYWDLELYKEIMHIGHKNFMLSCTMIEPVDSGNPCVIVRDYGQDIHHFDEEGLSRDYKYLFVNDWNGSMWPPCIVHIDLWDLVGGLSIEYSPGMYSDPDLSRKLYEAGVRYFKGIGTSLAYHFGSKSTKRVVQNKGRKTFLLKWGLTSRTFTQTYLQIGTDFFGYLKEPRIGKTTILVNKIKRLLSSF